MLRLAAHDLMDYYENADGSTQGGSDGCLDFNDSANVGLYDCVIKSRIQIVYFNFCSSISLADFIVISAEAI